MTKTNIRLDQMPVPRFGVRYSKTHPTFTIGEGDSEVTFKTRLITVGEDRQVTRTNAKTIVAEPKEGGEEGELQDLTPEQQEHNLDVTAEIVVALLKPRTSSDEDREKITPDWFNENMTSEDIGPLLFFLRRGEPQPELDPDADSLDTFMGVEDPNAEA